MLFDRALPLMHEVSCPHMLKRGMQDQWRVETMLVDPQTLG